MKELKVLCNLYLEVDDDTDIEAALDSLYFRLDTDVKINVHSYEFQED
jgi:hypothetical protein